MSENQRPPINVGGSCLYCVMSPILAFMLFIPFSLVAAQLEENMNNEGPELTPIALIAAGLSTAAAFFSVIKSKSSARRYEKLWWRDVGIAVAYGAWGVYLVGMILGSVEGFFKTIEKLP